MQPGHETPLQDEPDPPRSSPARHVVCDVQAHTGERGRDRAGVVGKRDVEAPTRRHAEHLELEAARVDDEVTFRVVQPKARPGGDGTDVRESARREVVFLEAPGAQRHEPASGDRGADETSRAEVEAS